MCAGFRKCVWVLMAVLVLSVVFAALYSAELCEAMSDDETARSLAEKLGAKFEPESMSVRVSGNKAFAKARGIYIDGLRIDRLSIEAILTGSDVPEGEDADFLASLIGYSWGEIELLESDVNEHFTENEMRDFPSLAFRFSPDGFHADAVFAKSLLFTLRIRLSATGRLGLRPDGVYIEDPAIYIEGVRQPGFLVNEIMEKANPLIRWSSIPFRVVFREISMTEHSAIISGGPRDFEGGAVASWSAREGVLLH